MRFSLLFALFIGTFSFAQNVKVRGVVTDSENVPVVGYGSGKKTMPSGTTMHMSDYNGKMEPESSMHGNC